jgi:hypothetical protein
MNKQRIALLAGVALVVLAARACQRLDPAVRTGRL